MQGPLQRLCLQTLRGLRADHTLWSTFAADHALTSAIVDVTQGLRADLTRSAERINGGIKFFYDLLLGKLVLG